MLLRDTEDLGELHLGEALFFAQRGDLPSQLLKEASVVVGRRGVEVRRVRGKVGVVEEVEGVDVEVERVR